MRRSTRCRSTDIEQTLTELREARRAVAAKRRAR